VGANPGIETQGTELDTGLKLGELLPLNTYWEMTRGLYRPFECSLRSGTSDVYTHEMPGGQYTNLKFQSQSLGLEEQWEEVKLSYAMANRVLGDIVKVSVVRSQSVGWRFRSRRSSMARDIWSRFLTACRYAATRVGVVLPGCVMLAHPLHSPPPHQGDALREKTDPHLRRLVVCIR
jgi:hypothetical protein